MDILATNLKKCLICKSGDIVEKNRHNDKDGFMIYGRNGARPAVHIRADATFQILILTAGLATSMDT